MKRRTAAKAVGLIPFMVTPIMNVLAQEQKRLPAHHIDGGFINTDSDFSEPGFFSMAPWVLGNMTRVFSKKETVDIPHEYNDGSVLKLRKPYTTTWIGHSTVLIQMEGVNILTDPVWSDRIGPIRWSGTPRLTEPGIKLDKLPPIDVVLISHNHYDHLDESTIEKLAENSQTRFFVPLRLRDWFEDNGIRAVEELDWWEGITVKNLKIICTPAQHFSNRWLSDHNQTLWCSWSILGEKQKLFFAGDSGYCSHFKQIGRRFGPFDLTLFPIGGYEPRKLMKSVHMNPAEAVQSHADVRGSTMLGIHWGAYKLTDEPLEEPPKKLREAVDEKKLPSDKYWTLKLGETREW